MFFDTYNLLDFVSASEKCLNSVKSQCQRCLTFQIDWNHRLIGILGVKGVGKTTFLLQKMKSLPSSEKAIYLSLDHFYFLNNSLVDLAESFMLQGGTYIFLDNVHKSPYWIREVKMIYKELPKLKVVFVHPSVSGMEQIEKKLDKYCKVYQLRELSFREYLNIKHNLCLPYYPLSDILLNHKEVASTIKKHIPYPVAEYYDYLRSGCFPFQFEDNKEYDQKLLDSVNIMFERDIQIIENISYIESIKLKKLLVYIAQHQPLKPNISQMSKELKMTRNFLLSGMRILERSKLIHLFYNEEEEVGEYTKPVKIYLYNTNLVHVLFPAAVKRKIIREIFLINQTKYHYKTKCLERGQFLIDTYTLKLGAKNDIDARNRDNSGYYLWDDIEVGKMNHVPLYLMGFLY